jgi:hypothetical protein
VLDQQHNYADAEPVVARMLAIKEAQLGPNHREVVKLRAILADTHVRATADLLKQGRIDEIAARLQAAEKAKRGCFIATAACGSADAPLVQTLRAFRDDALSRRPAGRIVIATYEFLSPRPARFLATRPFLRRLTRVLLVRPAAILVNLFMSRRRV